MPLNYVFKDLSSKTKHIMSSDNKNITFSDIEQIIKNYANEKRVLVEVFCIATLSYRITQMFWKST